MGFCSLLCDLQFPGFNCHLSRNAGPSADEQLLCGSPVEFCPRETVGWHVPCDVHVIQSVHRMLTQQVLIFQLVDLFNHFCNFFIIALSF